MKPMLSWMQVVAVAASAIAAAPAQAPQNPERLLKAAMNTELVDGNLKAAIEQYKKVVESGNRPLAAQALLHIAECYQKLGDAQARQVFERVVREYPDQKKSVEIARERLGVSGAAPIKGDRPVWSGPKVDGSGTISPNGRLLTYTDWWGSLGLMVRDMVTGAERHLTAGTFKSREGWTEGEASHSVISRDGRQVAYHWSNAARRFELRVVNLQTTGTPEPRRVVDIEGSQDIVPFDWSPDNHWIAAYITRQDQTGQIALVRAADGFIRVLKSVSPNEPDARIKFSPDGRYIAYGLTVDGHPLERHVYVMSVDGTREATVVDDHKLNSVMGWSPDGRYLLFSSDSSGNLDLWAAPIADGRPAGAPFVVKPKIGTIRSNGITDSGTMYVWKEASPIYLQVAPIDLATGHLTATPGSTSRVFITSRGRPAWSPDGKQLVYMSCYSAGGPPCRLFIRSMESGQTREITTPLPYLEFPRFSPDGKSLITRGDDQRGRRGIYRVDTATGETVLLSNQGDNPAWSADGHSFIYRQNNVDDMVVLIDHDVTSGTEHEFLRVSFPPSAATEVSPDRRFVATITRSADRRESILSVIPVNGGAPRTLLRVTAPAGLQGGQAHSPEWTPDSRSILLVKMLGGDADRKELWIVPVDGSAPRKLDTDIYRWLVPGGGFHLSPDGKQIAFVAATGDTGYEIWALENFLPASNAPVAGNDNRSAARR